MMSTDRENQKRLDIMFGRLLIQVSLETEPHSHEFPTKTA